MTTTNMELERQGGFMPAELGQLLTAADLQKLQTLGLQNFYHWLMLLGYDLNNETPLSGVAEDSGHLEVTATGDLEVEVAPGVGFVFYDGYLAADEFDHDAFMPAVLEATETLTIDAHHASNPRWDIIVIEPTRTEDQAVTRRVKNPSTLAESDQSVNLRSRYTATVSVVKGTAAASPSEPAVPPGKMKIARVEVPASSGASVVRDCRQFFQLGHLFKGHPAKEYARDFIPNPSTAPNALLVSANSPVGMSVVVTEGRAVIRGVSRWYPRETLTVTAAHATLGRIDLVVAKENGTLDIVDGTPHASPSVPSAPANSIPLAEISVPATDTTISAGQITDLRDSYLDGTEWVQGRRRPYGDEQFDQAAINHSKLSVPEVFVDLGTPTLSTKLAEIPIELFYPDQVTEYEGPFGEQACAFEVTVLRRFTPAHTYATWTEASADFTTELTGTAYYAPLVRRVSGSYPATQDGDEEAAIWFKPDSGNASDYNLNSNPGFTATHIFWMPARTGTLKIELNPAAVDDMDVAIHVRPLGRPGGCRWRTFTIAA